MSSFDSASSGQDIGSEEKGEEQVDLNRNLSAKYVVDLARPDSWLGVNC
jgi:hypothetical protein